MTTLLAANRGDLICPPSSLQSPLIEGREGLFNDPMSDYFGEVTDYSSTTATKLSFRPRIVSPVYTPTLSSVSSENSTLLELGCYVTSHDSKPYELPPQIGLDRLNSYYGEVTERSLNRSMQEARNKFGPINILVLNTGYDDKVNEYRIWDLPLDTWEETHQGNARRTFVTIKQFLGSAKASQDAQSGREIDNLATVVVGNSKPGEQAVPFDLIQRLKHELPQLNRKARINALIPSRIIRAGPIDPTMSGDYLAYHLKALARATAFVASDREAGHLSGECIIADDENEGRLAWRGKETVSFSEGLTKRSLTIQTAPRLLLPSSGNKIRVAVTIDLDAVSGWLRTGYSPENVLADSSAGFFAARVGVPRLVKMLERVGIANKVTWFIPGHSAESFTEEVQQVVDTGCEIALHGYAHEGAYSLTVQQERDILEKCIQITKKLTGKRPVGYRAPLYQVRESTLDLLEEYGFEYDSSLTDHDCRPFFAPRRPPFNRLITASPRFKLDASYPNILIGQQKIPGSSPTRRNTMQLLHGRYDANAIPTARPQFARICRCTIN